MVIVDAYNLLMADGAGGIDLDDLRQLARASRYAERGVVLVCDGGPKGSSAAGVADAAGGAMRGVRVVYAGRGADADSLIEHMLAASSAPRRLLVVSDDRRLRKAARRLRAPWIGCLAFLARLHHDERRSTPTSLPSFATSLPLDAMSVRHWLDEFGIAGDHPDHAGAPEELTAPTVPPKQAPTRRDRRSRRHLTDAKEAPAEPAGPERIDPLLLDALEEWAISPEDLDMRRWLDRGERR